MTVRFTEEEYAALKGKCEIAGMKMEPFVRALVEGCRIKPAPPNSYNKLRQQLAAIGNNLNQLTHIANATGRVSASQLDRAQSLLEDMWRCVRDGYYNVGSIFDVSMTYGNKPYPIPEIKPEQMDKAIKELERLSPVNIISQNEGVVGYDAEQHAIVFPTAMPQREVLARLPAEIVIATAEQHTPGISQAPYLRKTAMAVSVEFCGRFSLPMPDTAAATLDGMDTHIPPGEERKTLEEIRELSVTIGDTVEKALGLQRGQSSPQRDEAR